MNPWIVRPPKLTIQGETARIAADLVGPDQVQTLWFECDATYAQDLSSRTCDTFLVASLLPAMRLGLNISVEGAVSSKLFYNLTNYYMEVLPQLVPGLRRKSQLRSDELIRTNWGGELVYTGFSAGVDSFCTFITHSDDLIPREFKVSRFFFNNVGSHGQHRDDRKVFRERLKRVTELGAEMDIPVVAVDSNLNSILKMDFQLTHTIRNISVALLFQNSCGKFLYSSAVHYKDVYVGPTYDIGHADPITLPLLSTETTECISASSQYKRHRRTEIVSSYHPTYRSLDVCIAPRRAAKINCSKCWKCMRTQLSLDVIGALRKYDQVFEHSTYLRFRSLYIAIVRRSKDPLLREIREAIVTKGFTVPFSSKLMSFLLPSAATLMILKVLENPHRVPERLRTVRRKLLGTIGLGVPRA
jgi:hypothetical protein